MSGCPLRFRSCRIRVLLAVFVALAATRSLGADSATLEPPQVARFLERYCADCHSSSAPEADLALDELPPTAQLREERQRWEKVLQMLEIQAMPPEDQAQPKEAERAAVVAWLERELFHVDCELEADPGRVTVRRLNRAEYNNTIRDLLGLDLRPADAFPSDDVGYGFDNIGDVLSLPPLLMEKYLQAAEQVAQAAILVTDRNLAPRRRLENDQLTSRGAAARHDDGVYNLYSAGSVLGTFEFPCEGQYILRVEAGADQAGNELAKMQVRLKNKGLGTLEVKAPATRLEFYELAFSAPRGEQTLEVAFINDFYDEKARQDRNLHLSSFELIGPVKVAPGHLPESHRRIMVATPSKQQEVPEAARKILGPLMRRAFRRPVQDDELETYVDLVELAVERGDSFERGIQVALTGLLVSPHFLFRIEVDARPSDPEHVRRLNDFELATRLSYFLWSSMPDDELFRLAEQGRLQDDRVLEQQVRRMLQDEKAWALVENFGGQWLNLRLLDEIEPDPQRFAGFSAELKAAMRQETLLFFEAVLRENRSILELLEAQFTYVNEPLARHYGIPGIRGDRFQRVSLAGLPRAGVLTQASILTLTSNPTRTSPVKRGKWIMENILGTPPPEPPANVPLLEQTQKAQPNLSLREQMELHRKDPGCASCHRQMDALGLAFEHFDAIGRFRDRDGNLPIDASGSLPGEQTFAGPLELVKLLSERREQFSRTLTEKMMTYALGRGLEYYDRCAADKIVQQLEKEDYRIGSLVTQIVLSDPFRKRRGDGGSP